MSRQTLGFLLLAVLCAAPLSAQNGREHFISPDSSLDAVHAGQQQAFVRLRDSTSRISAAGARLMSDMSPSSSLAWMQARARGISEACGRSSAPLANARRVTEGAVWPQEIQKQAQASLLKAMSGLASELETCQKQWTALAADTSRASLRENAPYQMKLLQDKLNDFNRTAGTYLRYISVKLPPPGSPNS